jgi:hypothetical protein
MWIPIEPNPHTHAAVLFLENLKRIKQATISWAHEKKVKEEQELKHIEQTLLDWQDGNGRGFCSSVGKRGLVRLELRRRALLAEKKPCGD